jgi:hypothetical protein
MNSAYASISNLATATSPLEATEYGHNGVVIIIIMCSSQLAAGGDYSLHHSVPCGLICL